MSFSRLGILAFVTLSVFLTTNCSYYNRVMSRKNLVDGSVAYKERNFAEAEDLFRRAAARDPEGETLEGRTAQLFLARTLHSQYIGNREDTAKAEDAIAAYKKMLQIDSNEQSAYKAVAGLLENLQRNDEWQAWVTERANNESILPQHRAEALTNLAARQNTCANEISDTEATRKEIERDGKPAYQYVKPEKPEDLERLRACVTQGLQLTEKAVGLEPDQVKNAKAIDITTLPDAEIRELIDLIKAFESARSYRASILIQASRLAEMDGNNDEAARLRSEADAAREGFVELSNITKDMEAELEARVAAAEAAANANKANANANANANAAPAANQ
jgi:hypothetical protein